MENQPVISLKNRPYFTDCVKWNEDGQIAVCLDAHVHIITPIVVDIASKEESYKHVGFTLPPLEKLEKNVQILKADDVQTSYLNEEGYRCVNWSQSELSKSKSCLLVVVTTRHRVLLYQCSTKDPLKTDWQLYADITDKVKENAIEHQHPTKINPHHTLYASWSRNIAPDPFASKAALLATSNKGGDICIWDKGLEYATTIAPHTSFVNLLEWTSWKKTSEDNTYIAYIVSASTNGTVALSSVKLKTQVENGITNLIDVEAKVIYTWFEDPNQPSIPTLLKIYDDLENNSPYIRIAVCKGISLHFLSLTLNHEDIPEPDRDWASCYLENSAMGLGGGSWLNDFDFRCYTIEGEGLLYHLHAEGNLELDQGEREEINNKLVQKYKQQWMDEQAKVDEDDLIGASDAIPYLWGAGDAPSQYFTAIFFSLRPAVDIHFRPEAQEDASMTFILQKPRGLDAETLMDNVDKYVNNPYFFFMKPARGLIRELLEYLIDDENPAPFERWLTKLKDYMESEPVMDENDLTKSIFCDKSTIAGRILLDAKIELKNYRLLFCEELFDSVCKEAHDKTIGHYLGHIFHFALKRLDTDQFTDDQDKMALLLLADYALSMDLIPEQTLEVYLKLQDKYEELNLYQEIAHLSNQEKEKEPFEMRAREKCPVCGELVQSIGSGTTMAQCAAGHFWELCSITRRVLYSPSTRKCVSCGAKSLQPSQQENNLTDYILKHCCRCVYCGGGLLNS